MAATTEPTFEFTPEQERVVGALAASMKLLSVLLLVLALARISGGVVEILTASWAGLWSVIEGLVTAILGLVLLAGAADTRFIVDTKGYDKPHLLNAFTSLSLFYKIQIGLALLIGAIVLLRIFV